MNRSRHMHTACDSYYLCSPESSSAEPRSMSCRPIAHNDTSASCFRVTSLLSAPRSMDCRQNGNRNHKQQTKKKTENDIQQACISNSMLPAQRFVCERQSLLGYALHMSQIQRGSKFCIKVVNLVPPVCLATAGLWQLFFVLFFLKALTSIRICRQCAAGFGILVPHHLLYLALFVLVSLSTKQGIVSRLSQHIRLPVLCFHLLFSFTVFYLLKHW